MSDPISERLYFLLPSIYRQRDLQQGQPLRTLLAVLQSQYLTLQDDIEALYDNWFIETADDWVVPYLADLVGIDTLNNPMGGSIGQRRWVANAIAYRRRKGTLATLEHVLQDVTGWCTHVLEYGPRVSATQHMAHLRLANRLIDVHHTIGLASLDSPFDPLSHTLDVREISQSGFGTRSTQNGRYNLSHLGLFIYRLTNYPVANSPARGITKDRVSGKALPPGCYTFDSLGRDRQLFNLPEEIDQITSRMMPDNLPLPIDRALLADDLAHFVDAPHHQPQDQLLNSTYYGPDRSLFVLLNGAAVPPSAVASADLSRWQAPPDLVSRQGQKRVAIDPVLGRLLVHHRGREAHDTVEVSYNYAFSQDMGGGPYPRYQTLAKPLADTLQVDVMQGGPVDTLAGALAAWQKNWPRNTRCLIQIWDNGVYAEPDLVVQLPKNSQLVIQAADGQCPTLLCQNGLVVDGSQGGASLTLNGLLIDGPLEVDGGIHLAVTHCSLMPHGIRAKTGARELAALQVTISDSICGPINLPADIEGLSVTNSILDGGIGASHAHDRPGPVVDLTDVTVFGQARVKSIRSAVNVLFTRPVRSSDTKTGTVSYSSIPAGSAIPRGDHCLFEVPPIFTSTQFGDAGYGQLSPECPPEILRGAADGSEMGAFHDLYQSRRTDNLRQILDDYLPFGLSAGIFYVT